MTKRSRAYKEARRAATKDSSGSPAGKTTTAAGSQATELLQEEAGKGEIRKDAALLGRALRERWPTDPEKINAIMERLQDRLLDERVDDETFAKLMRPLIQTQAQNQRDELGGQDSRSETTINIVAQVQTTLARIGESPEYVEQLYGQRRAGVHRSESGADGDCDLTGPMGNAPAPRIGGPGADGPDKEADTRANPAD